MSDKMREALEGMVSMYVALVESGDAGFWDAEKVPQVTAARSALQTPPSRPVTAGREEIARIVDPRSFEMDAEYSNNFTREAIARALAKADAILALGSAVSPQVRGRSQAEVIEEWRAARQDVFDNTTKISEENTERWTRLSNAEHTLMSMARALSALAPKGAA
jgi:hypothetical protein